MLSSLLFITVGCQTACSPALPSPAPIGPQKQETRVIVVINQNSTDSESVGSYYVRKRGIPKENVVFINVPETENLPITVYQRSVEDPVRDGIRKCKHDIDYIVLAKGVPIRLNDDGGYSLDGHLAVMDLPMKSSPNNGDDATGRSYPNPYFNSTEHFTHAKFGFYLVTRLDGYNADQAKKLVDNSLAAKKEKGLFFFDEAGNRDGGGYADMQKMLKTANDLLKDRGFESRLDTTKEFIAPQEALAGYASWGSNDDAFNRGTYQSLKFKPGSIAETYVSTSGRTFDRNKSNAGQSVIADLIEHGVTGIKGYVSEPYTFALAQPPILFDRYTKGFNLAESFYAASLVLNWKDIVIGDPLCAPYK